LRKKLRCKKELFEKLEEIYENIVKEEEFQEDWIKALENFDEITENKLKLILKEFYPVQKSRDQAWKSCRGLLYERVVFKTLKQIINKDDELKKKFEVITGEEGVKEEFLKEQIVIRNWNEIWPDADILLINKKDSRIKAIISCKTSLRERLTETAFWKREIEERHGSKIFVIFITSDKDEELKNETNRYIILHVIDYTFITNKKKYEEIHKTFENRPISEFGVVLKNLK